MYIRLRYSLFLLVAGGCRHDAPSVELSVPPSVRPGSVPITAAISFNGSAALKYRWNINADCTLKFQDPNAPSTILEIGEDCAGKSLLASLSVSSPDATVSKAINLQVTSLAGVGAAAATTIQIAMNVAEAPGEWTEVTGTAGPWSTIQRSHLWLVVNPVGDPGHWPQGGPLNPKPPDGKWEMKARFGGNTGDRYNVSVVLADDAANESFIQYLAEGKKKNDFPAKPLPNGTLVLKTVLVTQGGERPCMAAFQQPKRDESVGDEVPLELTVTKHPSDKSNFYVLQKKGQGKQALYWYKGTLEKVGGGANGRISHLGGNDNERITLSVVAVNDAGKAVIDEVRQKGHREGTWPYMSNMDQYLDECASVDIVRSPKSSHHK